MQFYANFIRFGVQRSKLSNLISNLNINRHNFVTKNTFTTLSRQFKKDESILIPRFILHPSAISASSASTNQVDKDALAWATARLSNENGYLSWNRNAYMATICGATMNVQELIVAHSEKAAAVMLFIAFANVTCGTISFTSYLSRFHEQFQMSRSIFNFQRSMAVGHLLLWYIACLLYFLTFEEFLGKKSMLTADETINVVTKKKGT